MRYAPTFVLVIVLGGCAGESPGDRPEPDVMVYVDSQTGQPIVAAAAAEIPAVNPQTGRRTLLPGLYCERCREWKAAPPLEVVQRNPAARTCPQCRGALQPLGPRPPGPGESDQSGERPGGPS